jgi:hypothetical protein
VRDIGEGKSRELTKDGSAGGAEGILGGRTGRRMSEGVVSGEWVGVMRGAVSG